MYTSAEAVVFYNDFNIETDILKRIEMYIFAQMLNFWKAESRSTGKDL